MSDLEEMGNTLMGIALQYTHPNFEDMYPDWGTVCGIGEELVRMSKQPTLNENQQIVLDYLKDKCNVYSFISHKPFEAILRLSMLDPEKTELRVINTIDELTYEQQAQVLQAFASLVLEQEELND